MSAINQEQSLPYAKRTNDRTTWTLENIRAGMRMDEKKYKTVRKYIFSLLVKRTLIGSNMAHLRSSGSLRSIIRDVMQKFVHSFSDIPPKWLRSAIENLVRLLNKWERRRHVNNVKGRRLRPQPFSPEEDAQSPLMTPPSTMGSTPPPTRSSSSPSSKPEESIPHATASSPKDHAFHETLIRVRKDDKDAGSTSSILYSMSDIRRNGVRKAEAKITLDDISWDAFLLLLREDGLSPPDTDQIMYELDGEPMVVTKERLFKNCIRAARSARAARVEFWIRSGNSSTPILMKDTQGDDDKRRARLRKLTDFHRLAGTRKGT